MNNKGYTLVEILIVATIIGSFFSLSIYNTNYVTEMRFNIFCDFIFTTIKSAKEFSLENNIRTDIYMEDNKIIVAYDGLVYQTIDIPNDTTIYLGNATATNEFDFYFTGNVSSLQSGTITINNTKCNNTVYIKIRPVTGMIVLDK